MYKIDRLTRLGSMFIDHIVMSMLCGIFCIPILLFSISGKAQVTHDNINYIFIGSLIYVFILGAAVYFLKDSFDGRSIGKRITKLQVVDNKTGLTASPLQCLIRNLFTIIWPIEVIASIIDPNRRIGDWVANTKVIPYVNDNNPVKTNYLQIIVLFFVILSILYLVMLPINSFLSKLDKHKNPYIPSSYNEQESKNIMQLISNDLGNDLTPDIRVYDSMENSDKKYISALIKLKQDYYSDRIGFNNLDDKFKTMLYSIFPKGSFHGQIKFYYHESNGDEVIEIDNI